MSGILSSIYVKELARYVTIGKERFAQLFDSTWSIRKNWTYDIITPNVWLISRGKDRRIGRMRLQGCGIIIVLYRCFFEIKAPLEQ